MKNRIFLILIFFSLQVNAGILSFNACKGSFEELLQENRLASQLTVTNPYTKLNPRYLEIIDKSEFKKAEIYYTKYLTELVHGGRIVSKFDSNNNKIFNWTNGVFEEELKTTVASNGDRAWVGYSSETKVNKGETWEENSTVYVLEFVKTDSIPKFYLRNLLSDEYISFSILSDSFNTEMGYLENKGDTKEPISVISVNEAESPTHAPKIRKLVVINGRVVFDISRNSKRQ